jgi:hypothetical protein
MEEQITISKKEYESLLEENRFLDALRMAGVDNWEGYNEAWNIIREWDGENN